MYRIFLGNKTGFALLLIFSLCFSTACVGNGAPFNIPSEPFRALVEGVVDGESVKAEVYCDPSEHKTKEIYEKVVVKFTYPEKLCGITATLLSSGEGFVRYGNITCSSPYFAKMSELYLFLAPSGEPYSIEKNANGGYNATYVNEKDKIVYVFNADGEICNAEGKWGEKSFSFKINILK